MEKYLGVKLIEAKPMTVEEYNGEVRPLHYSGECREGYMVQYPDSYISWSPKDVFEKAYRPINGLTFGLAIEALKQGKKVARKGWNDKGMWLMLQIPDAHSKMSLPYIYMKTADNKQVPWLASQTDVLSEDWEVIE